MVEEIHAKPYDIEKRAELNFYFPNVETPEKRNQRVSIYVTSQRE
jgi:hypothetical protein